MKIVVCMKQVPDTTTRVQIAADGMSIEESNVTFIVNPYDEFAIEEALRLKEGKGGEVIVICVGPERATAAIRTCLAMGADRAIQIKDPAAQNSDPLGFARILAAAIRPLQPDVILAGKYGVGDDHSQVPAMLAEMLDLPQISGATKIDWQEGRIRAHREIEGGEEILESSLPAVISAHKGLNEPRYASLKGIMGAKKKEILEMNLAALGIDSSSVGAVGRKMVIEKISLPPARGAGKLLTGEPAEVARQIVELLHNEAKVI
jgi:electron transfer flavoprotein beta subunit